MTFTGKRITTSETEEREREGNDGKNKMR